MPIHPLAYGSSLGPAGFLYGPHQGADLGIGQVDISQKGGSERMLLTESFPSDGMDLLGLPINVSRVFQHPQAKAVKHPVRGPAGHDDPFLLVDGLLQQCRHGGTAGDHEPVIQAVFRDGFLRAFHDAGTSVNPHDLPGKPPGMGTQFLNRVDRDIFRYHKPDTGAVVYLPEDFQLTIVFLKIIGMGHRHPTVHEHVSLASCQRGEYGGDVRIQKFGPVSLFREDLLGQIGDRYPFRPIRVGDADFLVGYVTAREEYRDGQQGREKYRSVSHNHSVFYYMCHSFCFFEPFPA